MKRTYRKYKKYATVGQVNRIIRANQELKYYDGAWVQSSLGSTPLLQQLSAIPQGNTDISRNGDRLKLYKIHFRGDALCFSADAYNRIRVVVFQWFPATLPTAGSILLPGLNAVNIDFASHYAHDTRQQYRVMYDRVHKLIGNASTANTPNTAASVKQFVFSLRIPRRQLQYVAGTTTGSNQIYIMAFSDSAGIPNPSLNVGYKCMFTDS